MIIKRILWSGLALVSLVACGGGGGGASETATQALAREISEAQDGDTITVDTAEAIASVNLAGMATGVTLRVADGDLAGTELTKLADLGDGAGALRIVVPQSDSTFNTNIVTTTSVNSWLASQLAVDGVDDTNIETRTQNGFVYYSSERIANGVMVSEGGIKYANDGSSVEGNVGTFVNPQEDNGLFVVAFREGFSSLTAQPVGDLTYVGDTVVFAGDDSYTDAGTNVTLNFTNNTGTFTADGFSPDPGVTTARNIAISGQLAIDQSTGSISSSSNGTITVNGGTTGVYINGLLTGDGTGAAGTIVTTDDTAVDGVIGGIYAVKR